MFGVNLCLQPSFIFDGPAELKAQCFRFEPHAKEQRYILKTKVPVPCDLRVRRSRGDAREGDRLLVVCRGVEGLLEHRQHWRDCRHKQERGEESTPQTGDR